MPDYLTFKDMYEKIQRIAGDLSGADLDKQKDVANMVYLDEILVCDDLFPCLWFLVYQDNLIRTKTAKTATGITAANPPVVSSAAHGFANGDIIQFGNDVGGMVEVRNGTFLVADRAAGTFELQTLDGTDIDGSAFTAFTSGGTIYHRGVTPSASIEKVLSLAIHGYSGELDPIGETALEETTSWWDPANIGRPERFMLKKYFTTAGAESNRLLWFPNPQEVYQMRLWYEKQISPLSADTDVPILPPRYHNAIVSGSVARLVQYGQVQIENAVIWPSIYKAQIAALVSANRKWWRQYQKDERSGLYLA